MKRFIMRPLVALVCATGLVGVSTQAMASAFQIWEQDGASIGNYHAGYAAEAADASTAFYNPAGITRFKNQQLLIGADAVMTSFKYKGTVATSGLGDIPMQTTAQGGTFGLVPMLHYVAPLSCNLGFGFSIDAPFGLKTNYGNTSAIQYASTYTSITVIDYSPSLAYQFTNKLSAGLGFDIQTVKGEFDSTGAINLGAIFPATLTNKADDTGYGGHFGVLYDITDATRVGLSYHTQVAHHLTGSSTLLGPLMTHIPVSTTPGAPKDNPVVSNNASTNITLPGFASLGVFSQLNHTVSVMGNINYTQWSVFQNLILKNAAGIVSPLISSKQVEIVIPEHYHNTWNLSVGADYLALENLKLRAGLGYDQTPLQDAYRNTQLPDNSRYVIALGGHFQANKAIGVDLGWEHFFFNQAVINPPTVVAGLSTVTTNGHATGGADVIGGQLVWDIA